MRSRYPMGLAGPKIAKGEPVGDLAERALGAVRDVSPGREIQPEPVPLSPDPVIAEVENIMARAEAAVDELMALIRECPA